MSAAPRPAAPAGAPRVPWRVVLTVALGTLLNPLNSSMIAVALVRLHADFSVTLASASWLVSGFYLAAAVGQPLMGRFADALGPRRVFCAGLAIVAVTGLLAPLAPAFGWLVAVRVVQALGTSAAYPAGLALIRSAAADPEGRPPAGALGSVTVANSVSAALGPVLGGGLVVLAGWQAIFAVNVAIAGATFPLALRWLPADAERPRGVGLRVVARGLDLPGVGLFAGALVALLGFLLSLSTRALWWLLPIAALAAALLVRRERACTRPFLDVRMLARNRALLAVYGQFAAVNVVFYSVFFGLPQWLEEARGFHPGQAGLLMLPIAGLGVIATPVAARLIRRSGPRTPIVVGAVALTVGSLALLGLDRASPVLAILAVGAVLGIPNGFNNLGLQAALYRAAPPAETGAAGGLFQTARYVGAILSTSVIALVFGRSVTTAGLHEIAIAIAVLSAVLVATSLSRGRGSPGEPASAT